MENFFVTKTTNLMQFSTKSDLAYLVITMIFCDNLSQTNAFLIQNFMFDM